MAVRAGRLVEQVTAFCEVDDVLAALAVDGAIGEDSGFHQMYGDYGQGVEIDGLIVLPEGWECRLVRRVVRTVDP